MQVWVSAVLVHRSRGCVLRRELSAVDAQPAGGKNLKPKFTDLDKYPNGYTPSNKTDVKKTFERIKKQQQQIRQEQKDKVKAINWRTA
jgi:hypothetical protein